MQSKDPKGSSQQAPFTSKIMGSILASYTVGVLLYLCRFKVMAGGTTEGVQYLKSAPGVLKILEIVSTV